MFLGGQRDKCSKDEVFIPDANELKWEHDEKLSFKEGTEISYKALKILRVDKEAGVAVRIHHEVKMGERKHSTAARPFLEEAYVLSGKGYDYNGDIDGHLYWMPGMYLCRQPGNRHGNNMYIGPKDAFRQSNG